MGRLMNRHNAKLNAFAVQQLNLTSSDRVLEIGFGGGVTLPLLIKQAGFVGGVDRSLDMVKRAKAIFSDAVSSLTPARAVTGWPFCHHRVLSCI